MRMIWENRSMLLFSTQIAWPKFLLVLSSVLEIPYEMRTVSLFEINCCIIYLEISIRDGKVVLRRLIQQVQPPPVMLALWSTYSSPHRTTSDLAPCWFGGESSGRWPRRPGWSARLLASSSLRGGLFGEWVISWKMPFCLSLCPSKMWNKSWKGIWS